MTDPDDLEDLVDAAEQQAEWGDDDSDAPLTDDSTPVHDELTDEGPTV